MTDLLAVPATRAAALRNVIDALQAADNVILTTHVNADGDGAGSEVAMAAWLRAQGKSATIVNPTSFPDSFRFIVSNDDVIADAGSVAADRAIAEADTLLVLDTAEASRIGRVAKARADRRVVVIDHHVATESALEGTVLSDTTACATGELVYDLLVTAGMPESWPTHVANALYTAIVTDTGSFRYANTTPRTHAIAGDLIARGVDPEQMYRNIHANVPMRRVRLLRHALDSLTQDEHAPITWLLVRRDAMEELGATSDDLEGIVEHARSLEGTEVAILFRETADGATKVSLRSAGDADVNTVARQFNGGGHVKASGALIGQPPEVAIPEVLAATRAALGAG